MAVRSAAVHLVFMKVSLQRVTEASAIVLNELGTPDPTFDMVQIGPGLVLTVEVEPDDDEGTLARMAHRVLTLHCFDGPQGRLSLSVQEMHGEILSIPQPLTILRRPAVGRPQLVSHDADDEHANLIWIRFNEALRSGNVPVREGGSAPACASVPWRTVPSNSRCRNDRNACQHGFQNVDHPFPKYKCDITNVEDSAIRNALPYGMI